MDIKELEKVMQEYGVAIRAIPNKSNGIMEKEFKSMYPSGRVMYLEAFGREMLVTEYKSEHAGKFLIEPGCGVSTNIWFDGPYFDSIEDAVKALLDGTVRPANRIVDEVSKMP